MNGNELGLLVCQGAGSSIHPCFRFLLWLIDFIGPIHRIFISATCASVTWHLENIPVRVENMPDVII